MSKTVEERYDEIKKEIWQISESYTQILKDIDPSDVGLENERHLQFLHYRLRELIEELRIMNIDYIKIPFVYRRMVNKLILSLSIWVTDEYRKDAKQYEIGDINPLLK